MVLKHQLIQQGLGFYPNILFLCIYDEPPIHLHIYTTGRTAAGRIVPVQLPRQQGSDPEPHQ